jgi:hypothetical protein
VAVKAEASRPEFCRESNIEGRKQREDGICRESGARRPEDQKPGSTNCKKNVEFQPKPPGILEKFLVYPKNKNP